MNRAPDPRSAEKKTTPNPIPVPSKTPPIGREKGRKQAGTVTSTYGYPLPPPRRRSPVGNTRPHGAGGINIRDMPPPRTRERTPEPRRSWHNDHEPEPRRSRNAEREPEAEAGTTEETITKVKVATGAGASHGKIAGSQRAEAKNLTGPLADLPHHHLVAEAEAEAVAGDLVLAQKPRRRPTMIQEEPKPRMNLKLPGNLKNYDGTERPDTWIEDYYNAVTFAGGTPNIARRMLQLYLVGPARIWLSDLEKNSIFCWFDLKNAFEKHFRGTYKRPATTSDLQACIQKKGETSRNFLTRWLACRVRERR
ncbi:hypothetical protein QYE76_035085 [Lolium multiflorum]|uniref:Retrotransposon gag domain-containing protein n=1 Tax=Lolium multiflorum TaxID=4521 RepID=A0AAD8R092_LOLMU|nr:hypothetical protein QYE76_035085 [Lolium multiflorum]